MQFKVHNGVKSTRDSLQNHGTELQTVWESLIYMVRANKIQWRLDVMMSSPAKRNDVDDVDDKLPQYQPLSLVSITRSLRELRPC